MALKRAMVTGASEGIGREFAVQLARQGYSITAVARDEGRLKELVEGLGGGSRCLVADLATAQGLSLAMEELKGGYELLVNNAGSAIQGPFLAAPLERQRQMLDLNVTALVSLAHAFLGQAQPGAALVNLSSALAFLPTPSLGLYAATKALVASFSESLWYEQKARGVHVMGLCPGVTATAFYRHAGGGELSAPRMMVQGAEEVVAQALRALRARRGPIVRTGVASKLLCFLARFLSRRAVVSLAGKAA